MKLSIKYYFIAAIIAFIMISNSSIQAQWSMTGGIPGGNISTLSSNNDIIFAGTEGAGGFTSADDGNNWIPARDGISGMVQFSLVTANNIYAGTRYGAYISYDYGQHWARILVGDGYWHIHSIISTMNALYVGYETGNRGFVRYTTDQGQSWHAAEIGGSGGSISAVTSMAFKDNKVFVSTSSDGVFLNEYGSNTWDQIFSHYCSTLLIDNEDLFIAGSSTLWVYNITNGTLNSISSGLINIVRFLFLNGKMFAATSEGLYRSDDRGITWDSVDVGTGWPVTYDITAKDNLLFVSVQNNGVYRSSDLGHSWTESDNGILNTTINNFTSDNEKLYCCDTRGLWSSSDGNSWERIQCDYKGNMIKVFYDTIYVLTNTDELIKRNKNDTDWVIINLPDYDPLYMNDFLVVDHSYYLGTDLQGVFKSTDYGVNWEKINNGLSTLGYITVLSLYYSNNLLYAGTYQGLFSSSDGGASWSYLTGVASGSNIVSISAENNMICAGSNGLAGLFFSTDYGENWNWDLAGYYINSVLVKGNCIMAGLIEGFLFSNDFGQSWYIASDGLYPGTTGIMDIHYYKNNIYISIIAQGIWRRSASEIIVTSADNFSQKISEYELGNCYPNPFNSSAKINYSIRNNSYVKLSVYDVLGKLVKILFDGEKSAGYYEVEFDGSELSSGVYFYRIEVTGKGFFSIYTNTKKMILLK